MFGVIMGIFSIIADLFRPAVDLVDELHVSEEEKLQLRNQLAEIQGGVQTKLIELQKAKVEALSKVQVSEASSKFWLTANWRPLCSIALVALIIVGSFGLVTVHQDVYQLATVFLGAYGLGRSGEKIGKIINLGKND